MNNDVRDKLPTQDVVAFTEDDLHHRPANQTHQHEHHIVDVGAVDAKLRTRQNALIIDTKSSNFENDSTNGSTTNEESNLTSANGSERGQWSSGLEFLLSCISMSVGLGNVWRFPYVAYENGGGAFLIPYLLLLFVVGRPIYYMELIIGQFCGRGPIKMWKCVPALKGVGFAQLFSVSYVAIFYNYLMGISVMYFVSSFSGTLPWTTCHDEWIGINGYCANNTDATNYLNQTWPELYYKRTVLNVSRGLWDVNSISWKMALCLLTSWVLVYLSIVKGVTSLGKVAYFTAIFPYAVLVTLLGVALSQDGAIEGIKFFFTPQFDRLLDPIVWYRAVEQSFFSLAVCFGSLVMFSSYNNFTNNVKRDCVIISVLDTVTSLLAGCVIFAVLGAMAHENGEKIENVVQGGPGLAFIAYPEGLSKIKFMPQLWSMLFFVMLFTLGIGSSVAMIETILTCVKDQFESLQKHKGKTAFVFCAIFFLLGLPLTTDAGTYMMSLLDNYGVGTAAFLYGILEVTGIFWIYGLQNFCEDVHFMLRRPVSIISKITWSFITPLVLIGIFIYGNVLIFSESKAESSEIPAWGTAIGWCLAAIALIQIPLWFFIELFRQKAPSLKEKASQVFRPTADYGPIDEKIFAEWSRWKIDLASRRQKNRDDDGTSNGSCKKVPIDDQYLQAKSSLFVVGDMLNGEKQYIGADNPAFVADENSGNPCREVTSQNHNEHHNQLNNSFRIPRLLSSRNFDDNY